MKNLKVGICLMMLVSCKEGVDTAEALDTMMETDRYFSSDSEELGMREAFLKYADDEAVLLRPNRMPVVGKENIETLFEDEDGSQGVLTWEPTYGAVASSGDLGYTYGLYKYQIQDTTLRGTYISVWKKNDSGKWRYTIDSGNSGLGN